MRPTPALDRLEIETAFAVLARAAEIDRAGGVGGRPVINLGIGQPDFPTPAPIVEAAVKALRDGAHGYTPAPGTPALREAVAMDLAERGGVETDPDRIVALPGGKPAIFFAILMFGAPGAEILYPDPGFPIYRSMIRYTGATPVPAPLRADTGYALDASEILARLTPATRLVIVNSPGNPTGGVAPADEIRALAEGLADRPDVAILSDEIYSRLLFDGRPHVSPLAQPEIADRVILLDGASKRYAMTGWRLGWSVWPAPLVAPAVALAVNSFSCVSAATQAAGVAALTGPQDAVETMRQAFDARRRRLAARLNALPGVVCPEPGGAFYAFASVAETGLDGATLQTRLLEEQGVAAIAGSSFGDAAPGCLRFSCANSLSAIEEAMDRFEALLSGGG